MVTEYIFFPLFKHRARLSLLKGSNLNFHLVTATSWESRSFGFCEFLVVKSRYGIFLNIYLFDCAESWLSQAGSSSLHCGMWSNPGPLYWEHGVLATSPPRKPHGCGISLFSVLWMKRNVMEKPKGQVCSLSLTHAHNTNGKTATEWP